MFRAAAFNYPGDRLSVRRETGVNVYGEDHVAKMINVRALGHQEKSGHAGPSRHRVYSRQPLAHDFPLRRERTVG